MALGQGLEQDVLGLRLDRRATRVLLRVHPLVGFEQRLGGLRGLAGQRDRPYEQPMWKPSPCSVNAAAAPRMIGSATWGPGRKSTQNSSPPMRYASTAVIVRNFTMQNAS